MEEIRRKVCRAGGKSGEGKHASISIALNSMWGAERQQYTES
jgi:hypothetical protein